jgi:hypothetical protein
MGLLFQIFPQYLILKSGQFIREHFVYFKSLFVCLHITFFFNFAFNFTGYDWNKGVNYKALLETYRFCGFQATNFGSAVEEINKMVRNILN